MIMWGQRFFFPKPEDVQNDNGATYPDFYEGFSVAAVMTAPESGTEISKNDAEISETGTNNPETGTNVPDIITRAGNDELLFGLPVNIEEAVEAYLAFYRNANDMSTIVDYTEHDFVVNAHHASGQFIRNSWFLWWYENHEYSTWPKSKPPIVEYFNNLGIYHADDISAIIIRSAWRQVHGKPFDTEGQVKFYKEFWKQQGFPDGIYKPKVS